jgi:16S rRNA (guanine(966)-N(2))-methyltransferase RsmD
MRIIAGQYRGKNLSAGSDLSIRPITNRLKETIFSIIHEYVSDKRILDLFSGSGSLGIEALSRGARHLTFVEREESSIKVLNKNLKDLHIDPKYIKIVKSDVLEYLEKNSNDYHLIFSDPPFKYPFLQQMVNQVFVNDHLVRNGLVVLHHEIDNPLNEDNVPYKLLKQKKIGRSILSFITKEATDD